MVVSSVVVPVVPPIDQIADAHLVPAHAAGDRRRHPGIIEIELRLIDRGDRGVARCGGDGHLRHALVIGLLGGVVVLAQLGGAVELRLGELELRLGLRLLGLGGLERKLERPRLDDEQKIALLDQLAVGEVDRFEIAAHPRRALRPTSRASNWPVKSLHSCISLTSGLATVTAGGGGAVWAVLLALPEAPIMIEQRRGGDREKQQTTRFSRSPRRAWARPRPGSRLRLARRRLGGLQVRRRLAVSVASSSSGSSPFATSAAVPVSLLHRWPHLKLAP